MNKRSYVKNGSSEYYIIDTTKDKMLLQRRSDGEIVVACNRECGKDTVSWQHGHYFGKNLIAAAKNFYGKGA